MRLFLGMLCASTLASADDAKCTGWKKVLPIERIPVEGLTAQDFFTKYSDRPVVLTGAVSKEELSWWSSLDSVGATCAGSSMPVKVTAKERGTEWGQLEDFEGGTMPMDKFIKAVQDGAGEEERMPLYGFDYGIGKDCPALFEHFTLPGPFKDCVLQRHAVANGSSYFHWPSLMLGEKHSRSELHLDNSGLPFWMTLMKGSKKYLIMSVADNLQLTSDEPYEWCPPPNLGDGKAGGFRGRVLEEYLQDQAYSFKGFGRPSHAETESAPAAEEFAKYPKLCEATVHETVLQAGEVIYIPNSAPHGALNLETTAAITANFFSPHDHSQRMWLDKVCEPGADGFTLPPNQCASIKKDITQQTEQCEKEKQGDAKKPKAAAQTRFFDLYDSSRASEEALGPAWSKEAASAAAKVRAWMARSTVQEQHMGDAGEISALFAALPKPYIVYEDMTARNGNHDGFAHTAPPLAFQDEGSQDHLLRVCKALLRRGMQRAQRDFVALLRKGLDGESAAGLPAWLVPHALLSVRTLFDSFENFLHQLKSKLRFGPSQLVGGDGGVSLEYGPETSFWLGFRPSLGCRTLARLGPEVGGPKSWCNHRYLSSEKHAPRYLLSVGSGDDFTYEDWALAYFETAAFTPKVATLDCFSGAQAVTADSGHSEANRRRRESLTFYELCTHGDDPNDLGTIPSDYRSKCVSLRDFLMTRKSTPDPAKALADFPHFDAIKMNIEAFEYMSWFDALSRSDEEVDAVLRGTNHIHLEQHRLGMQQHGLNWASLLFGELLFATFYSAGFHPFATEKWHDSTAAQDVAYVNQSWWLRSELDALVAVVEPADSDVAPLQERTPHAEASWRERAEEVFSPASMCKSEFCETVRRSSLGLGAAQPAQAAPDPDMYSCKITNHLTHAVDIWWIPPKGFHPPDPVRVSDGVKTGDRFDLNTQDGHVFIATAVGASCKPDDCDAKASVKGAQPCDLKFGPAPSTWFGMP